MYAIVFPYNLNSILCHSHSITWQYVKDMITAPIKKYILKSHTCKME